MTELISKFNQNPYRMYYRCCYAAQRKDHNHLSTTSPVLKPFPEGISMMASCHTFYLALTMMNKTSDCCSDKSCLLNLCLLEASTCRWILSKVATTSIRDFGCARVAFPGFNAIGREDYFYKSADLIFLNDCLDQVNAVRTFRLKCYQLGNPEAIYL
ncbi:unnamed protein product, partial [Brassica rapa subsp. trilocularis]